MRRADEFFQRNRILWAIAAFLFPVVTAISGTVLAGIIASGLVILPGFVIFDSDRPWWSPEVRDAQRDPVRSRAERRALTLSTAAGFAAGLLLGIVWHQLGR